MSVLMNISTLNGILTSEEVISITNALRSLISNSTNFQSSEVGLLYVCECFMFPWFEKSGDN